MTSPETPMPGTADADAELIYEALRFFFWAAGQGISPVAGEDAAAPDECFWQYGERTGDEDWETIAERYRNRTDNAPALLRALEGLVAVAERNIYPQPDKPDSAWAKLEAARAAIASARS